jgi:histidinol phosphatase-like enzyme
LNLEKGTTFEVVIGANQDGLVIHELDKQYFNIQNDYISWALSKDGNCAIQVGFNGVTKVKGLKSGEKFYTS